MAAQLGKLGPVTKASFEHESMGRSRYARKLCAADSVVADPATAWELDWPVTRKHLVTDTLYLASCTGPCMPFIKHQFHAYLIVCVGVFASSGVGGGR